MLLFPPNICERCTGVKSLKNFTGKKERNFTYITFKNILMLHINAPLSTTRIGVITNLNFTLMIFDENIILGNIMKSVYKGFKYQNVLNGWSYEWATNVISRQ